MSDKKTDADVIEGEIVERREDPPGNGPSRSKFASRLPWILTSALMVFIAGLFAAPWVEVGLTALAPSLFPEKQESPVIPPEITRRIAVLEQQMAQTGNRLDQASSAAMPIPVDLTDITARLNLLETVPRPTEVPDLTTLEERLRALESQQAAPQVAGTAPDPESLRALESRLSELETARTGDVQQGQRVMVLSAFERQMNRGTIFTTELTALRALVGEDSPGLDFFANHAASGIPALNSLMENYPDAARRALIAENTDDDGWLSRTFSGLKNIVTVRRVGEQEGNDPAAILSRAEMRLAEGDLTSALTELSTLPEENKTAMADWLQDATLRLEADRTLAALWQARPEK